LLLSVDYPVTSSSRSADRRFNPDRRLQFPLDRRNRIVVGEELVA